MEVEGEGEGARVEVQVSFLPYVNKDSEVWFTVRVGEWSRVFFGIWILSFDPGLDFEDESEFDSEYWKCSHGDSEYRFQRGIQSTNLCIDVEPISEHKTWMWVRIETLNSILTSNHEFVSKFQVWIWSEVRAALPSACNSLVVVCCCLKGWRKGLVVVHSTPPPHTQASSILCRQTLLAPLSFSSIKLSAVVSTGTKPKTKLEKVKNVVFPFILVSFYLFVARLLWIGFRVYWMCTFMPNSILFGDEARALEKMNHEDDTLGDFELPKKKFGKSHFNSVRNLQLADASFF